MATHPSRSLAGYVLPVVLLAGACTGTSLPEAITTGEPTDAAPSVSRPSGASANAPVADALEAVREDRSPLTGLVVVHRGEVVGESYGSASGPGVRQPVWSITKSVVSTLVGIALAEGLVDLDTSLGELFGDSATDHRDLTVEHLLTMTSGLDLVEGETAFRALYDADDWVAHVLNRPTAAAPGATFAYCSACVHLLTAALDRVTGDLDSWAEQRLFEPLGIESVDWERANDGSGVPIGGWGLALTARELAHFGQLHLDDGRVDGRQVVPADWVRAATTRHVDVPDPFEDWQQGYGYLWWTAAADTYAATGRGGQLVLVLPEPGLVVAATADLPDATAADAATFVRERVVAPLLGTG